MLMVFVGPLIGQGTSLAHGMSPTMPMGEMVCDDMPGMSPASVRAPSGKHYDWVIWEKCGYCSLLFQHPALTESNPVFVRLGIPPTLFLTVLFSPEQVAPPVFPGARSRAPPIQPLTVTTTFC